MSQVSIGTNGFVWTCAFYVTVIGTIGAQRIMEHGKAIAYGTVFPELPVQTPIDGKPVTAANVVQSSLLARSIAEVDGFYRAAIEAV